MKTRNIVLLVLGIVLLLLSLVPLLAGGWLMWAEKTLKDSEGFYRTKTIQLEKDSYAIATPGARIELGEDSGWFFRGRRWDPGDFLSVKIEGSSSDPSKQIFIGVAQASKVENYLKDVEYHELTPLVILRSRLGYVRHLGTSKPEAPTTQPFWKATAYGGGTQTLVWGIEEGAYALVLMNEDGSRGLDLNVSFGVRAPPIVWGIGVALLVVGIVLLAAAAIAIYLGARRSRTPTGMAR